MSIDDAIENLKYTIDCTPKEPPQNADEHWKYDNNVFIKTLDMAIRSLEMQKKLAEFRGMDICYWDEDYDYEENNISEYEYEVSVDDFLIDEAKGEAEKNEKLKKKYRTRIDCNSCPNSGYGSCSKYKFLFCTADKRLVIL